MIRSLRVFQAISMSSRHLPMKRIVMPTLPIFAKRMYSLAAGDTLSSTKEAAKEKEFNLESVCKELNEIPYENVFKTLTGYGKKTSDQYSELILLLQKDDQNPRTARVILDVYQILMRNKVTDPDFKPSRDVFFASLKAARRLYRGETCKKLLDDIPLGSLGAEDVKMIANLLNEAHECDFAMEWIRTKGHEYFKGNLVDSYLMLCDYYLRSNSHVDMTDEQILHAVKKIDVAFIESELSQFSADRLRPFDLMDRYERLVAVYSFEGDWEKALEYVQKGVEAKRQGKPSMHIYKSLISAGYLHKNYDLVLNCFEECQKYYPDKITNLRHNLVRVAEAMDAKKLPMDLPKVFREFLNIQFDGNRKLNKVKFYNTCLPKLIEIAKRHENCKEVLVVLEERLKDLEEAPPVVEENMRIDSSVINAVKEKNHEKLSEIFPTFIEHGEINQKTAMYVTRYLQSVGDVVLMDQLIQCEIKRHGKPMFHVALRYLETLLEKGEGSSALKWYDQMTKKFNFHLLLSDYAILLEKAVDTNAKGHALDRLLRETETSAALRHSEGKKGFIRTPHKYYAAIINSYAKERKFPEIVKVFKRNVDPKNPLKPLLTAAVFNNILVGLLREWNNKDFNLLYERMVDNLKKRGRAPERFDASKHWKESIEFYENLGNEEKKYLFPPPAVVANRITHNIRLSLLVSNGKPDEAIQEFRDSVFLDMTHPVRATYQCLASAYMKKDENSRWCDSPLLVKIGDECVEAMKNVNVDQSNIDDVLVTVQNLIKKNTSS